MRTDFYDLKNFMATTFNKKIIINAISSHSEVIISQDVKSWIIFFFEKFTLSILKSEFMMIEIVLLLLFCYGSN